MIVFSIVALVFSAVALAGTLFMAIENIKYVNELEELFKEYLDEAHRIVSEGIEKK